MYLPGSNEQKYKDTTGYRPLAKFDNEKAPFILPLSCYNITSGGPADSG